MCQGFSFSGPCQADDCYSQGRKIFIMKGKEFGVIDRMGVM
jgi:hypothetical protein